MKLLSQRDPAWCSEKLGQSALTVGRYGCTTTCLSMLSDFFRCFRSPLELAHNVKNYTKDGLVVWEKLNFDHMRFDKRVRVYEPLEVEKAMKDPLRAVLLEVNNGQHWVVALRKTLLGNDVLVADPWTGTKVGAKAVYHNITGAAYFSSK